MNESNLDDDSIQNCSKDRFSLKSTSEDSISSVIIAQSPQMLIMRTKGSDKFFIANFD